MIIDIDYREKMLHDYCNNIKQQKDDISITSSNLSIGDIIIKDGDKELIIFERKNIADLASSIQDGRYNEQSLRLNSHDLPNHNIVYLIEGNLEGFKQRFGRIDKSALYSSLVSLQYFKGFSVIRTFSIKESAEVITRYAVKLSKNTKNQPYYISGNQQVNPETNIMNEKYCDVVQKVKKDNVNNDNIHNIWLSQIPNVSNKIADAILTIHKSIWSLKSSLEQDPNCLDSITTETEKGQKRKINKTAITNIKTFLLVNNE
tara:strand:- start:787 stop:1566 length:780 start_codon:yes stop_codon:yes gene_type:complete